MQIVAQETVLVLMAAKAEDRDMVSVMVFHMKFPTSLHHGPILFDNNNNITQPSNHGVGLRHHVICRCARIPPLSRHALQVLRSIQTS